jgi:signal transduction histidine kinase
MEFKTAIDENLDLGRLDAGDRLAVYCIVQEALTNREKHARGPVVLVARNNTAAGEKTLRICVSDHGDGLTPARAAASPGLGLRIMRFRAAALGDSFSRRGVMEFKTAIDDNFDLGRLDAGDRLTVYRILQEALTNCEKHARGPIVLVARNNAAAAGEKTLRICVSDQGDGLTPAWAYGSCVSGPPPWAQP